MDNFRRGLPRFLVRRAGAKKFSWQSNLEQASKLNEHICCLIHNAHLRKITSFCKISDLKITHLEKYLFNIYHLNSGLVFKNKSYYTTVNFQKWTPDIRKHSKTRHICDRLSNGQPSCYKYIR
jgi:hypothetical protein